MLMFFDSAECKYDEYQINCFIIISIEITNHFF